MKQYAYSAAERQVKHLPACIEFDNEREAKAHYEVNLINRAAPPRAQWLKVWKRMFS